MGFFDWLKETLGSSSDEPAHDGPAPDPTPESTSEPAPQARAPHAMHQPAGVDELVDAVRSDLEDLRPEEGLDPDEVRRRSNTVAGEKRSLEAYGYAVLEHRIPYEHQSDVQERLRGDFEALEEEWSEWKNEHPGWWTDGDSKRVTAGDVDGIPGYRRSPVIDDRLTAKDHGRQVGTWGFWGRPRVLEPEEAERLFARGFRVENVDLHRVATDKKQLKRLGLPGWEDQWQIARDFGLTKGKLYWFASERLADGISHYVQFRIPKSSGGSRVIMAPKRQLRAIQRKLLRRLVDQLPVSEYAHGFRKGRSIKTYAEPHVGKQFVIGMDLEDFFGSVHYGRIRGLLVAYGYSFPVASTLGLLMTAAERQRVELEDGVRYTPVSRRYTVQGAPTSPGLCNAIAKKLDHRLAGLADKYGYDYTRYADDIAFSGDDEEAIGPLLSVTREIADDEGFAINRDKTRVMHSGQRQEVAGVVVNDTLGLSRQERRRLRAMIHRLNQEADEGGPDPEEVEYLEGKLAYLQMLNSDQADALREQIGDWYGDIY